MGQRDGAARWGSDGAAMGQLRKPGAAALWTARGGGTEDSTVKVKRLLWPGGDTAHVYAHIYTNVYTHV